MQDDSELQLVNAAVAGNIESFGELCRRYYGPMVAIAYSLLSDHQLAEDAAQESYARALVNLRRLKNRARFSPWLAAICRNVAKDMLAAKARRIDARDLPQTADWNDPDENGMLVRQAIEKLPGPAREVISLRYYGNLSYEEIASVLGTSRGSISGTLARAKRKMAKYLKHNGFPENEL